MKIITLVGAPNSGKTTLFNYLSGQNYKTVNYPGATVEYHAANLQKRFGLEAMLLDTPGIISLVPTSKDEEVTIKGIYSHPHYGAPDLVIATMDASQLSRHLLLAMELKQANFDLVIALTMVDILERKGFEIDIDKLQKILGVPIIKIDGRSGEGVDELISVAKRKLETNNKNLYDIKIIEENNQELLNLYKEIEKIEAEVIRPKKRGFAGSYKNILHKPDELTIKIDKILLSKGWGFLIFFLAMLFFFSSVFWLASPLMDLVDMFFGWLGNFTKEILGHGLISDLISDGIISGLGAVSVFVPQILILFLILGLLEDSGYLARGAMLIDRPLRKIGLNGRSFVPMVSGFACAIPAIMAARTIPNAKERLLTIFIIPLISCSARIPVYALLIAYLVPPENYLLSGLILTIIYIFSITISLTVAGIINKFRDKVIRETDNSTFILELPTYRLPKLRVTLSNMWTSTKVYVKGAGPIILTFSIILWALTYFPNYNPQLDKTQIDAAKYENAVQIERINGSYAADLGKIFEPVMKPMGLDWRVGVAILTSFAAREVFVSSMALMFKATEVDENSVQSSIIHSMKLAKNEDGSPMFTTSSIIGLILFFIIALQCVSTMAITKRETGGWRIPVLQFVLYSGGAYILSVIVVNSLRFFGVA